MTPTELARLPRDVREAMYKRAAEHEFRRRHSAERDTFRAVPPEDIPPAFAPLLRPARYKAAYGGRGGAKSHFFAERLVERCVAGTTRAVCLREIQKSLAGSVKQLLEDKIVAFDLGPRFRVLESRIEVPRNGSSIIFQGMQNHTAESIKSLEGYDVAWVEEAQSLSQRSNDLLRPTIRKPGSEIWYSWNPRFPTDPVDAFFRGDPNNPPPDSVAIQVSFADNPWFPDVLRADMEYDRRRDPDKYLHIWLGGYQRLSEARVFRNWKIEEFDTPDGARFYLGGDWGFSIDPTVLVRCFIDGRTLYVDYEAYQIGCEIDKTPELFDQVPGSRLWPIRADSARPETISYLQRHGFPKIVPATKGAGSVEDGIEFLKSYDIVVHPRCVHTGDELASYSWKIDKQTDEVLPVLEDADNHVIDSLRYALEEERLGRKALVISPQAMAWASRR